jgi:hypothetical protein
MAVWGAKRALADDRLKRLAKRLEAVARRDEEQQRQARQIAELRRQAASSLHALCADFVDALNGLLARRLVELSPPEYNSESLQDPGPNVFQINAGGRLIHLEFRATETLTSTDQLRTPYTLYGAARCFNQELLERVATHELLLFCCLHGDGYQWVLCDPAGRRTTPLDREALAALMERLL